MASGTGPVTANAPASDAAAPTVLMAKPNRSPPSRAWNIPRAPPAMSMTPATAVMGFSAWSATARPVSFTSKVRSPLCKSEMESYASRIAPVAST
jgi:hypothetical protein